MRRLHKKKFSHLRHKHPRSVSKTRTKGSMQGKDKQSFLLKSMYRLGKLSGLSKYHEERETHILHKTRRLREWAVKAQQKDCLILGKASIHSSTPTCYQRRANMQMCSTKSKPMPQADCGHQSTHLHLCRL